MRPDTLNVPRGTVADIYMDHFKNPLLTKSSTVVEKNFASDKLQTSFRHLQISTRFEEFLKTQIHGGPFQNQIWSEGCPKVVRRLSEAIPCNGPLSLRLGYLF